MMNFLQKKFAWAILYTILLTAFTLYVVLDTFVITRVYTTLPTNDTGLSYTMQEPTGVASTDSEVTAENSPAATQNVDESGETTTPASSEEAVIAENTYTDANISITISESREYDTTIYVADVQVSSPEYLKTAFANNAYGKNVTEKTSTIAAANQAILAINGDFYGTQTKGYVIRNGTLYRDIVDSGQEDLVVLNDGSFEIISEDDITAAELLQQGATQILSFGPALIENGNVAVTASDEVGKAKASNPRTAIGIINDLHYVFVVSDGRTSDSTGLSLLQLADFMQGLGVDTAYNLDGGGSSTMVFNGEVINNPTTGGNKISERSVSDIVYIGY